MYQNQPMYQQNQPMYQQNQPMYQNKEQKETEKASNEIFFSIKCHGKNSAFELKPDCSRKGFHTVRVECANILNNGNPKTYDWKNKVSLQITKSEMPLLIAFLLGFMSKIEFNNHNTGNTLKSLNIINQPNNLFVNLKQFNKQDNNQTLCALPIPFSDINLLLNVCLMQYIKNFNGVTSDSIIRSLELARNRITE
jgi:hypothetical protein